jgi:hypothetical protein
LAIHSHGNAKSDQQIYQDIPVKSLNDGIYNCSLRIRFENKNGMVRILLQQVDANGKILSTNGEFTHTIGPENLPFSYQGPHDSNPHASVVLSSHTMTCSSLLKLRPEASTVRFSIQPQSPGEFDVIEATLSASEVAAKP